MDNPRLPYLREKTRALPLEPGVYIMHEKSGKVIYVGKAKKLKNRVTSYFRNVEKHLPKVYKMVEHVWEFDYIVTDSEFEALILECSLIKQYAPKYNILLKDDKGYSYVRISPGPYSRLTGVLQKADDGATYLGPYMSSFVVRQTVAEANKAFLLPTCNKKFPQEFHKGRPCLNYYIKQCMGVCRGRISEGEYAEALDQALDFIKGGSAASIAKLTERMEACAENEEYERAAALRDRIRAIERITERQKVVFSKVEEQDVVALAKNGEDICAVVLKFRGGRLVDKDEYLLKELGTDPASVAEFLRGYYLEKEDIPPQVALHEDCEDRELLARWLTEKRGKKTAITVPQKGDQKKTADMAYNNAAELLSHGNAVTGREVAVLDELARLLGMERAPRVIEAYDISNFGAETVVGGMVVYENARPRRADYRKFAIKDAQAPDDYACMAEMIRRRFARYFAEKESGAGFGRLPDLILLDGGKGHVGTIRPLLREMGIDVPVFGMVKDDRHRTRAIAEDGGEIAISAVQSVFSFVTAIQEEVHRYSIGYSRARHSKTSFALLLTKVKGIGEKRAQALMRHFKTIKALKEAPVEELAAVEGMTRPVAEELRRFLNEEA
ncbi:MAG TPA: excinuclease ABC subunit UvrC [Oscillospiraceae bacterium]|nr:excinuclease ABC subunit UvrC [Oscillospiraceae bacterium]HNW04810.1 excinuclease ABC subunit UvrC [Oscillospiraceae bacterium]HPV99952.1 excinuclease ABC subunit UvrC [Oscillospiraceae bacterium]